MSKRSDVKKYIIKNDLPKLDRNVACIGYFDGVHRGHQALIRVSKDLANMSDLKSMVICFEPDPGDIINKRKNKHILSFEDRLSSFEALSVDIVCVIKFDEKLMKLSPEQFIKKYLLKLNIDTLVCGFDFNFAYQGKGNSAILSEYINTVVVEEVSLYSKKISSTRIRQEIVKGNFKLANRLLDYKYSLVCKVKNCEKNKSSYLCECVLKDKSLLLPERYHDRNIDIADGKITVKSKNELSKDDCIVLVFEDE